MNGMGVHYGWRKKHDADKIMKELMSAVVESIKENTQTRVPKYKLPA